MDALDRERFAPPEYSSVVFGERESSTPAFPSLPVPGRGNPATSSHINVACHEDLGALPSYSDVVGKRYGHSFTPQRVLLERSIDVAVSVSGSLPPPGSSAPPPGSSAPPSYFQITGP